MAAEVGRESTCVRVARQKDVVYGERDVTCRPKGLERATREAEVSKVSLSESWNKS